MVKCYDNFLSNLMAQEAADYAENKYFGGDHIFKSNACWNRNIVMDSFPVLIHTLDTEHQLFKDLKKQICSKVDIDINEILFYYWTRFSYIPWHNDSHVEKAMTIYLNREWNPDWGGFFCWEDKEDYKMVIPKHNRAVYNDDHTLHCTTPVNYNGGVRLTIQIFEKRK